MYGLLIFNEGWKPIYLCWIRTIQSRMKAQYFRAKCKLDAKQNYFYKYFNKLFWIITACKRIKNHLSILWTLMIKSKLISINSSASYTYSLITSSCLRKHFTVFSEDETFQAISWVLFSKCGTWSHTFNVQQMHRQSHVMASQGIQGMELTGWSVTEISHEFF